MIEKAIIVFLFQEENMADVGKRAYFSVVQENTASNENNAEKDKSENVVSKIIYLSIPE